MVASFSTFTYARYAEQFLQIDETDDGHLFCDVPGQGGDTFRVWVNEEGLVPVATSCRCQQFKHTHTCQHCQIVNNFYARIYKTTVQKHQQKLAQQEAAKQEQLKRDQEKLARILSAQSVDVGKLGQLYTNQGFHLMR